MSGGIGNQLFQLANVYSLSKQYNRKLFISDKNSSPRPCYWDSIFNKFKPYLINQPEFSKMKQQSRSYNWALTRFEYKSIELFENVPCYNIEGFYQSYKYFNLYEFKSMLDLSIKSSHNYTIDSNDVCIHIRRTDYMQNNFHKVLKIDYYLNALDLIKDKGKIYCFSDDITWCKNNFKNHEMEFVHFENEIDELLFMSTFQNMIIANSTFSYWAALLGNPKTVICPFHWFQNNCHLNTKDLRPESWIIINDDDAHKQCKFNKNIFNVISLGSACCVVHNIHESIYKHLGPIYRQPNNSTNFFDWLISDFRNILFVFENLCFRDDAFLDSSHFTLDNVNAKPQELRGGWSSTYKKVEHSNPNMNFIALHDVPKYCMSIPDEFSNKYKRRFERLYFKLIENESIYFIHCFDFQWLEPYFPNKDEINTFFDYVLKINPYLQCKLCFFVHPKYHDTVKTKYEFYHSIENLEVFYLQNIRESSDWKADHLNWKAFFE